MAACTICGEKLKDGARACPACGTSVVPTAQVVAPPKTNLPPVARLTQTEPLSPDARVCPACGKTYGPDFDDSFCTCGMELLRVDQLLAIAPSETPAEALPPARPLGTHKPPPGTRCLVLYGSNKEPIQYFPLEKDATLIGRLDAVEGNFPDINVAEWVEPAVARKVSRKHALVLRSRANQSFTLRPLAGNTGTQVDADMVPPLADYPLEPGRRIILGGSVRLKFEVT